MRISKGMFVWRHLRGERSKDWSVWPWSRGYLAKICTRSKRELTGRHCFTESHMLFFRSFLLLRPALSAQSPEAGARVAVSYGRELAYTFKWHNDNVDVRRGGGIRKKDFMWGRTWSEMQAGALWTNIDGPSPVGNQHMDAEVGRDESIPEVTFL